MTAGREEIVTVNPATGSEAGRYPVMGGDEVDAVLGAVHRRFAGWGGSPSTGGSSTCTPWPGSSATGSTSWPA